VVTDPQTIHQYLTQTAKQVDQITLLVDDLFQVSQLDAGGLILNRENASLSDLISDTLESFSELAKQKGINLRGSAEKGIDPLVMDVQLIGRVLNNLISNAIRHTPAGKEISLCASIVKGGVEVSVRDQGEGIRSEDLPHVFERFYRADKSRNRMTGGSGIGLAIVKSIVTAHGGMVEAESHLNEGSRFVVKLPKNKME